MITGADQWMYVIAAYVVTALVLGALVMSVVWDARSRARALADLEARGIRRRSET